MRLIGSFASQDDALTFGDYLVTIQLPNHVEKANDDSWQVWIERDDDLEQGQLQFREYTANPNDPRYHDVASSASAIRKRAYLEAEKRRKNFKDVRTTSARHAMRPATLSMICVGICCVVALLTKLGTDESGSVIEWLRFQPLGAVVDPVEPELMREGMGKRDATTMFSAIMHGQVWRLVTPIFLHFGLIHLLFNMMWVTSLGSAIERIKGPRIFLQLVLLGAVLGNVGEALWAVYGMGNPFGFTTFGGFSGVVYAFFGYAWLKGRSQPYEGLGVQPQTVGLMLGWLVLCMIGVLGNIANTAHLVGLGVGCLMGAWPTLMRKIKP